MEQEDKIQLFEDKRIRTAWDAEHEEWYFSIVDVVGVLTDSVDPTAYWRKLKQRLKAEGNETVTNCHALKMKAADAVSYTHLQQIFQERNLHIHLIFHKNQLQGYQS